MKFKKLVYVLILVFWPINLFLANITADFISYVLPSMLLILSFLLYKKKFKLYLIPLILIPILEPKLAILPLLIGILNIIIGKRTLFSKVFTALSLVVLLLSLKSFWGQTIFVPDHEARQMVLQNIKLYPNVISARVFQNKVRIPANQIIQNTFALTDPNNYFFGFHPRQIVDNQNLVKYPFLSIIFLAFGLYFFSKSKNKRFFVLLLPSAIITLSFLSIFDRQDFILWIPISILLIHGVNEFDKRIKWSRYFFVFYFTIGLIEVLRLFTIS